MDEQTKVVAGRHPLKQGLKHHYPAVISDCIPEVAGRHPLKQGLKLKYGLTFGNGGGRRAASTKTRIETIVLYLLQSVERGSQGGIH